MTNLVVVLTTLPDDLRTDELARTLVDERLVACVNISSPVTSVYRWNNAVERESERQLVIKTTRDRLPALETRLRTLHPYELPEFIVVAVEQGSTSYVDWVNAETRP